MTPKKEFKLGDKIMGINSWSYIGGDRLVGGIVTIVEKNNYAYIVSSEDNKYSGVLSFKDSVEFNDLDWIQSKILFEEKERLVKESTEKITQIRRIIYRNHK